MHHHGKETALNKIKAAAVSLLFVVSALFGVGSAAAVAAPAPAVTAAHNLLGKPLPKLDYSHAVTGRKALKGKPVQAVGSSRRSACSTPCFFYGVGKQTVSTDAATISFSVEQPSCTSTYCWHSLAENAVESADGQQVVEWGWNVDTAVNGDSKPHLFAYSWVNGVPGTYNGSGWVNAVGSACPAGMDISADVSVGSATVQNFGWQHLNGAWWAAYKTNWCGAFPDSKWTSPTFTQAGLVQIFGEVAAKDSVPTGVQMGSGVLGAAGPSAGARASSFGLGPNTLTTPALTVSNIPSVPTHYNAVLTPPSLRTFRYGGTY
jgi:neprosin-like protein